MNKHFFTGPFAQRGVALILVVSLMAFLILIVTALTTLLRVETQVLSTAEKQSIARQNALNALEIAIGELQKYAGPDSRVTARADILDDPDNPGQLENPWLTGVWDTANTNSLPAWLISGNEAFDLRGVTRGSGPLVPSMYSSDYLNPFQALPTPDDDGSNTVWLLHRPEDGEPIPETSVWAPKVPFVATGLPGFGDTPRVTGHYAYWIADEGVKASVGQIDRFYHDIEDLIADNWASNLASTEIRRLRQMVAPRAATDQIFDETFPDPDTGFANHPASEVDRLDGRVWENVFLASQANLLGEPDEQEIRDSYHDFTPMALGVLANTSADAGSRGLMTDLSRDPGGFFRPAERTAVQAFLNTPNAVEDAMTFNSTTDRNFSFSSTGFRPTQRKDLRRRFPILAAADTSEGLRISPVLTDLQMIFTIRKASSGSNVVLRSRFYAKLWNPYTSALVPETLFIEINNLPVVTMTIPNTADPSEDDVEILVDLQETLSNHTRPDGISVYRVELRFEAPDGVTFTGDDDRTWLPGRFYSWVGPNNASGGGSTTGEGIAQFYSNSIDNGIWEQVVDGATYPSPFVAHPRFGLSADSFALNARLVKTSDSGPQTLVSLENLEFDDFETTNTEFQITNNTRQFGFRVRFVEAGDRGENPWDKMDWFRLNDPRLASGLTFGDDSGGLPSYVPPNGFSPLDYTAVLIRRPEALLDRTMGATGKRPMEDIPLFELPHLPLTSVGSLQHAQLPSQRPLAMGNSWGGNLNAAFDRHFFSGWTEGINYSVENQIIPPHPRLMAWFPDNPANPAGLIDSAANRTSRHLLIQGAFNLNSSSAQSWQSILNGTTLYPSSTGGQFDPRGFDYVNKRNTQTGTDGVIRSDTPYRSIASPRRGVYARYAQTLAETYFIGALRSGAAGDTPTERAQRRAEIFRRGMQFIDRLSEQNHPVYNQPTNLTQWLSEEIVTNIRRFARANGRPFYTLEEFLRPNPSLFQAPAGNLFGSWSDDGTLLPVSALEEALFRIEDLHFFVPDSIDLSGGSNAAFPNMLSYGNSTNMQYIWPMAPGFLLQSDLITTLGPILRARSDTFLIRAYGDYVNPVSGRVEGRVWCEALVQRIPQTVNSTDSIDTPNPSGLGRQFQIIQFRWLDESEI